MVKILPSKSWARRYHALETAVVDPVPDGEVTAPVEGEVAAAVDGEEPLEADDAVAVPDEPAPADPAGGDAP